MKNNTFKTPLMVATLLFTLSISLLSACSLGDKDKIVDMSFMRYMTVKNKNAKRYGIAKLNSKNNSNKIKNAKSNEEQNDKFYLVEDEIGDTTDSELVESLDNIKTVEFIKNLQINEPVYDDEGNLIEDGDIITQETSNAKINDLFVDGNFVFMSFIANSVTESFTYTAESPSGYRHELTLMPRDDPDFDYNKYSTFCTTQYQKCFVLDTNSGFIYNFPWINEFYKNNICTYTAANGERTFGRYFISDNNFIIEKLMPNDNATIISAATGNDGWTYVLNNTATEIVEDKKLFYIKSKNEDSGSILVGSDKEIYVMNGNNPIVRYKNGKEQPLKDDLVILRKQTLYSSPYTYGAIYKKHLIDRSGMHGVVHIDGYCKILGNNFNFFVDTENGLKYKYIDFDYYLDLAATRGPINVSVDEFTTLLENKSSIYDPTVRYEKEESPFINVNNARVYESGIFNAKYYKVSINGEKLELTKTEQIDYATENIIMQPING